MGWDGREGESQHWRLCRGAAAIGGGSAVHISCLCSFQELSFPLVVDCGLAIEFVHLRDSKWPSKQLVPDTPHSAMFNFYRRHLVAGMTRPLAAPV